MAGCGGGAADGCLRRRGCRWAGCSGVAAPGYDRGLPPPIPPPARGAPTPFARSHTLDHVLSPWGSLRTEGASGAPLIASRSHRVVGSKAGSARIPPTPRPRKGWRCGGRARARRSYVVLGRTSLPPANASSTPTGSQCLGFSGPANAGLGPSRCPAARARDLRCAGAPMGPGPHRRGMGRSPIVTRRLRRPADSESLTSGWRLRSWECAGTAHPKTT